MECGYRLLRHRGRTPHYMALLRRSRTLLLFGNSRLRHMVISETLTSCRGIVNGDEDTSPGHYAKIIGEEGQSRHGERFE